MMLRSLPTSLPMVRLLPLLALAVSLAAPASAQVTGLSDWSLYLDPGHSQNENVGVYGYSEARKVLRVGLALRDMLLAETDIEAVHLSRTTDAQSVSLSQRVDDANALNADHFHSIHSNAGAPSTNFVFVLWAQLQSGSEPAPPYAGGRPWAEILGPLFGRSMRIPTSNDGAWGECDFYGTSSCRAVSTTPKGSRNFVQSFSLMPSALSEAGFHTNPTQNQRNMNEEWKVLEARTLFWAILDYFDLPPPPPPHRDGHRLGPRERPADQRGHNYDRGPKLHDRHLRVALQSVLERPGRTAQRILLPPRPARRHALVYG